MLRSKSKDLFHESTMTFGQHLEELRACLFKAILGLALGCAIGFAVGKPVANFIQTPLREALVSYYEKQATAKSTNTAELEKFREAGYTTPEDIERLQKIIHDERVSGDIWYIDAKSLLSQLNLKANAAAAPIVRAEKTDDKVKHEGLVPVVFFRPVADDPRTHPVSLSSQESFMIYMKTSMVAGAILASPWVFFQIWAFVAAGLYPHEKHYVHVFLPFSILLFLAGASMAFFFVFKPVLDFLLGFNSMLGIDPSPRISEWMGFVLMLPLGFGASFQLPLVMLFMERIGIVTVRMYLSSWRIAILAIFVLAMLLTPSGDPYSMLLMAGPLTVLYFGGVLLCRVMPRRQAQFDLE